MGVLFTSPHSHLYRVAEQTGFLEIGGWFYLCWLDKHDRKED